MITCWVEVDGHRQHERRPMRFQRFLFVQTAQVAGRFIHRIAERGIMKNSLFPEKDNRLSLVSEFKIAFPRIGKRIKRFLFATLSRAEPV